MIANVLLDTAIDQFGRLGFGGASTREIARISKTAMSSITYHFGGKQGLYLAAADHIAACVAELQGPALDAAHAAGEGSRDDAIEALLVLLDNVAQIMLRPESESWARFILREQQQPTEAFERLYTGLMRRLIETMVMLISRARPDLDDMNIRAMGVSLFGQAAILRSGRASVCKALRIADIDEAASALLRARLRANTQHLLHAIGPA